MEVFAKKEFGQKIAILSFQNLENIQILATKNCQSKLTKNVNYRCM